MHCSGWFADRSKNPRDLMDRLWFSRHTIAISVQRPIKPHDRRKWESKFHRSLLIKCDESIQFEWYQWNVCILRNNSVYLFPKLLYMCVQLTPPEAQTVGYRYVKKGIFRILPAITQLPGHWLSNIFLQTHRFFHNMLFHFYNNSIIFQYLDYFFTSKFLNRGPQKMRRFNEIMTNVSMEL